MAQPTLHTERLTLVPLADEHFELEVELDSDPEVMRYLAGRARRREEMDAWHRRRLAVARAAPGLGFWIGLTGDARDEFVGWWILQPPHGPDQADVAGEADLGYRLLRRQWRQGFAGEGSRELLRYAFDDLGLIRVFAQTMADNAGSRATMRSIGMTFVRAYLSAEQYDEPIDGAEQGEVEYEITRATWAAGR